GSSFIVDSPLGRLLESIGAGPTVDENNQLTNLTVAMLVVGPILLLGAILFVIGSRHLPEDQERGRAGGRGTHAGGHLRPLRRAPAPMRPVGGGAAGARVSGGGGRGTRPATAVGGRGGLDAAAGRIRPPLGLAGDVPPSLRRRSTTY